MVSGFVAVGDPSSEGYRTIIAAVGGRRSALAGRLNFSAGEPRGARCQESRHRAVGESVLALESPSEWFSCVPGV